MVAELDFGEFHSCVRKIVRRKIGGKFLPQPWTPEDVIQQTHVLLIEKWGNNYVTIASTDNLAPYLDDISEAANKALGGAVWAYQKRAQTTTGS